MPLRLLLAVAALLGLWWAASWWSRTTPQNAKKALIGLGLAALVIGGAALVLTGKLAGLLAMAAGLSPWIVRAMRLHQLWRLARRVTGQGTPPPGGASGPPPAAPESAMTPAQAFEVLGLAPGATADEIREAHRRLMRANHPDAGGSTWIAARLNQARDLLLG
jgi:DnaJ homolog subfamily C member 19